MSNLDQYKRELTALPLQYKFIDKEQAIKRVLTAIDALGENLEKDINEKWKTKMPVSGVVGLSLHVLLTYQHCVKNRDAQITLNKLARESADSNIKKARETIKHLENAQKSLWKAIDSQPKTIETESLQERITSNWEKTISSINLDIGTQKELLDKAKEVKENVRLQATNPIFLFTQTVAGLLFNGIGLHPVKAKIGRGEPSPIVRYLNTLTGEDVSQAQDAIANIYEGKKSGKHFIFKEVKYNR
ncbi:hypothetical protein C4G25_RS19860 [Vibrio parahaemolyticus]|nr:hypothetical protein [Vibrio parahaemolyticus]